MCNTRLLFWAKIDMETSLEMINLKWHNPFQVSDESTDAVAPGHHADHEQGQSRLAAALGFQWFIYAAPSFCS